MNPPRLLSTFNHTIAQWPKSSQASIGLKILFEPLVLAEDFPIDCQTVVILMFNDFESKHWSIYNLVKVAYHQLSSRWRVVGSSGRGVLLITSQISLDLLVLANENLH